MTRDTARSAGSGGMTARIASGSLPSVVQEEAASAETPSTRARLPALMRALRPHQWGKNPERGIEEFVKIVIADAAVGQRRYCLSAGTISRKLEERVLALGAPLPQLGLHDGLSEQRSGKLVAPDRRRDDGELVFGIEVGPVGRNADGWPVADDVRHPNGSQPPAGRSCCLAPIHLLHRELARGPSALASPAGEDTRSAWDTSAKVVETSFAMRACTSLVPKGLVSRQPCGTRHRKPTLTFWRHVDGLAPSKGRDCD